MYAEIEPYQTGMLEVGDGTTIYWETCGNPDGKPALVLHGGPGSGCGPSMRRYFNPAAYRIVLFDQRNCGRSRPLASDPAVSLAGNTTQQQIADIERLRDYLAIGQWLLFGWSWGSVLALAYAEQHTSRVSEIVLTGVGSGRTAEVELFTRGLGQLFRADWARFNRGVPEADRDGSMPAAYSRLLNDPDPAVRDKAARDWCDWEEAIVPTSPRPRQRFADPVFRYGFARLVTHYWSHDCFLPAGGVLPQAGRLGQVPGKVIQGNLDLTNLVGTPWLLAAAWPSCELTLIDEAGHGGNDELLSAIIAATDGYAGLPAAGSDAAGA